MCGTKVPATPDCSLTSSLPTAHGCRRRWILCEHRYGVERYLWDEHPKFLVLGTCECVRYRLETAQLRSAGACQRKIPEGRCVFGRRPEHVLDGDAQICCRARWNYRARTPLAEVSALWTYTSRPLMKACIQQQLLCRKCRASSLRRILAEFHDCSIDEIN